MLNNKISFILKAVFILLVLQSQVYGYTEKNVAQDQREKAITWFNSGQFERALPVFVKLVYDFPYDYTVKYYAGVCLVETGDFGKETEKNLLLASGSDVPARVWYYLGRMYHAGGNWNSAQRYYNRFKNNADSTEVRELRVNELIQFCYSNINPFIANEPGGNALPPKSEKENVITYQQNIQPNAGIIESGKKTVTPDKDRTIPGSPAVKSENVTTVAPAGKVPLESGKPETILNIGKENTERDVPKKDSVIVKRENPKADVSEKEKTGEKITADSTHLTTPVPQVISVKLKSEPLEFINFQINERITYLIEGMFQEGDALKEYQTGKWKSQQLDSLIMDLDRLRNQYHIAMDPVKRDSLAKKIQQTEYSDLILKNEIQGHFVKAAEIENQWWKDAEFSVYKTFSQVSDSLKKLQAMPSHPVKEKESPDAVSIKRDTVSVVNPIQAETKHETDKVPAAKPVNAAEIVYKIQLGICDKTISPQRKKLLDKISKIRPVESYVNPNGSTVCTTGNLRNFDDAVILQNQIRQEGIKDAFVIALKNGKRISLPAENKIKQ